jgi:hypothetical protein
MALSIYISLTIVMLHLGYFIRKPLNFLENSLVFMLIAIITRQCLTVMAMELSFYKLTEDYWLFTGLVLCRDILTPMVVVIFSNFYMRSRTVTQKLASFILSLAALLGLHYLAVQFGIITYVKWNFGYTFLMNAAFLLTALGVIKLISVIKTWENRQNESL